MDIQTIAPPPETAERPREDVSFRELVRLFWKGRVWIAVITLSMTCAAFGVALLMPKRYEAKAVISVVARDARQSGLDSAMSSLGSIAALVGLSGQTGGSRAEALATLQSDILTRKYITEQNLLPVLYASQWDAARHAWNTSDPKKVPTLWKANRYFSKEIRSVTEEKKTGLTTITVTWTDPVLAAKWANDLIALTNDYLRRKAIDDAQANMAYLQAQAQKTNIVEMRQVIFSLMQSELKNAMLAEGNREFAFKVIDPALPPERPSSPLKAFWAAGGFLAGLCISMLILLGREGWARTD
jgi:uncharacterized protein involved in exopolysaccharide biosynthesis